MNQACGASASSAGVDGLLNPVSQPPAAPNLRRHQARGLLHRRHPPLHHCRLLPAQSIAAALSLHDSASTTRLFRMTRTVRHHGGPRGGIAEERHSPLLAHWSISSHPLCVWRLVLIRPVTQRKGPPIISFRTRPAGLQQSADSAICVSPLLDGDSQAPFSLVEDVIR